jgi:hypothetical protein
MRKKVLIVGDHNPYEVLDGGIERLLIEYRYSLTEVKKTVLGFIRERL